MEDYVSARQQQGAKWNWSTYRPGPIIGYSLGYVSRPKHTSALHRKGCVHHHNRNAFKTSIGHWPGMPGPPCLAFKVPHEDALCIIAITTQYPIVRSSERSPLAPLCKVFLA